MEVLHNGRLVPPASPGVRSYQDTPGNYLLQNVDPGACSLFFHIKTKKIIPDDRGLELHDL